MRKRSIDLPCACHSECHLRVPLEPGYSARSHERPFTLLACSLSGSDLWKSSARAQYYSKFAKRHAGGPAFDGFARNVTTSLTRLTLVLHMGEIDLC